jgi:hypothetical protein
MPDDPNRNLDEQLSAWARKRRDEAGAPFELHPATRKLLQDEVARTFPKKPDKPEAHTAGWLKLFGPRLAFACVLCVALVSVVGLLMPSLAKSKSKGRHIALVRQQEKDMSADSERRDAPAQTAPNSSGTRAVEPHFLHLGDETGKSSVAESQPPAAPSLAENKSLAPEVKMKAEVKEVRVKAMPATPVEERLLSEKSREMTLTDKPKEPLPTGVAAPARESYNEKESNQALLRQRYEVAPAQASAVTSAPNAFAKDLKTPGASAAPSVAAPQAALDGANIGQRAGSLGGRGFAGGTASDTAPGVNLAFNRPQNRAKSDDPSLALTWQAARQDTSRIVSLGAQREIDRLGTSDLFYAAIPPGQAPQRYAQVREYRINLNSPPMPDVLSSFQFMQNGRQIRVVDADDSIYNGTIEQPPTGETARRHVAALAASQELKKNIEPDTKRIESVGATATAETLASQNVFFRVSGTNRTLNQLVVFEGNLLATTNQANEIVVGAKLATDQSAAAAGRQNLSQKVQQTQSGMIRGQATIGPSSRIEINAAPVSE